ncbi:MAG: AraC family transcriptional regulator [Tannerella sp.]|jgi:AraC-like DNA-binding protein|nr:AraC family transcriptional regulator [Tannerella sp.]
MKQSKSESLALNYSDVFVGFNFKDGETYMHMVKDHMLVYVYSGELLIVEGKSKMSVRSGECVFLRKSHRIDMTSRPKGKEQFRAIFLVLSRKFLREYYCRMDKSKLPTGLEDCDGNLIEEPPTPDITGLFSSMVPYFDSTIKPTEELIELKLQEAVHALLNVDITSSITLFDFVEPWKIDLLDFLNENYMYNLSLEEVASFTGRSLSTFKRDFKKISDLSPERWIMKKRLETAYKKIHDEGKKVSDTYLETGFKSLSHFSTAFKKEYGYAPTNIN